MTLNRGKYRHYIDIYEKQETDKTNALGEKVVEYVKVKSLFACIESRVGGLLKNRPADTVMSTVTHKISYPFGNYPVMLSDKHRIEYRNQKFEVNYSLNENFGDVELQVFVTERI